jgi:SOS-response transcriptional repressor LexA
MLDPKQKKIVNFYQKHRRMPTYDEMARLCGFASKNAVSKLVSHWMDDGFVQKDGVRHLIPGPIFYRIRVLGIVEAGFPTPAEESDLDTLSLDDFLVENKESSYMLRVKGDSMIDAGIQEGDFVIAERASEAKVGEIVIAEMDGGYTMKYLRRDKSGKYYLQPANKSLSDMYPEGDLSIVATVRGVVRKY